MCETLPLRQHGDGPTGLSLSCPTIAHHSSCLNRGFPSKLQIASANKEHEGTQNRVFKSTATIFILHYIRSKYGVEILRPNCCQGWNCSLWAVHDVCLTRSTFAQWEQCLALGCCALARVCELRRGWQHADRTEPAASHPQARSRDRSNGSVGVWHYETSRGAAGRAQA